jgi:hypothetical protein
MGWYNERYRHSLAAKGISTRRSFASVEDAEREAMLRFLLEKRQMQEDEGVQTPILDAQADYESKMEAWIESAFESDSFVIHLNPEMTGVDQPLHFERKVSQQGVVYWIGQFPNGATGQVTAEGVIGLFQKWYPAIEDVEVLE